VYLRVKSRGKNELLNEKKMKKTASGFHELGRLFSDKTTNSVRDRDPGPVRAQVRKIHHAQANTGGISTIQLTRPINFRCWRVIGQIAKAAKRDELMPVLLRAQEMGTTDARDIANHLLFEAEARQGVAQRLLQISANYRLLELRENRYALTEAGQTALRTQQIFVPEDGAWTIWASDDPLLATPILQVKPWTEPTAYDEVRGKDRRTDEKRKFEKLPRWLKAIIGKVAIPVVASTAMRIDHLEAEGEVVDARASLRAVWNVSEARLRIEGSLDGSDLNSAVDAPDANAGDIWRQLLESEGLWPQWDPEALALRVGFDDIGSSERETLLRTVKFGKPEISGYRLFDATSIERIPICARSPEDAQRWGAWRLDTRITSYATAERFSNWTDEALAPLAEFQLAAPSRQELASAAWQARGGRPTNKTWHLVAAEDWEL
jgi:hypothetical protein